LELDLSGQQVKEDETVCMTRAWIGAWRKSLI
jgi:hypothetical protein